MIRRVFLSALTKLGLVAGTQPIASRVITEAEAANDELLRRFPYPLVSVQGKDALREWERLRAEGTGCPVVLGNRDALSAIMNQFNSSDPALYTSGASDPSPHWVDDILALADSLDVPTELRQAYSDEYGEDPFEVELGEWPKAGTMAAPGLSVATDLRTGKHYEQVFIAIVPTDDPTTVPAYLRWGGWNACPGPELHVAVLRRWRDKFGAVLVGASFDVLDIRVEKRPANRDEALALANEQYLYCPDLVLQGTDTMAPLAATLLDSDWWFFWWD